MPSLTLQVDPYDVLGLAEGASLEQIRDAYRQKAKLHHPDAGGDTWAFRILAQAYESLSTARVTRAAWNEFNAHSTPSPPPQSPPEPEPKQDEGTIRPGINDAVIDPVRAVDVEKLWVRRQTGRVWLLRDSLDASHYMSCNLNVSWPSEQHREAARAFEGHEALLLELAEVFQEMQAFSGAISGSFQAEDEWFSGWLSYPSPNQATLAFRQLHHALRSRGFSIHSWTRDLTIPHERS